ncbi:CD209 antigen-like protein E [Astatotilapia calliptera]|uniref:CD209 antigen-like protein E n=1 Tax=Astatotilapia calliptera TaxID=8154 RepID=UPI000E41D713|nr:CD209 antigen-like protein E [Astatotilapia calliptera]
MMSHPQSYIEGETDSWHAKSSTGSKVKAERVALLVLCLLLTAAVLIIYRLSEFATFENTKTRESLKELEELRMNCQNVLTDGSFYKCEEGWEKHGGKCYYFCNSQSSWKQSRDKCRAKGGDLVKIDSREEQAFLERRVRELMKEAEDKFWIGLTDSAVEGRWLWVDGSLLDESLKFWAGKEPNNVTEGDPDGEDCVRMGEEYENKDLKCWFDQSCSKPQRSICEKAGVTAT